MGTAITLGRFLKVFNQADFKRGFSHTLPVIEPTLAKFLAEKIRAHLLQMPTSVQEKMSLSEEGLRALDLLFIHSFAVHNLFPIFKSDLLVSVLKVIQSSVSQLTSLRGLLTGHREEHLNLEEPNSKWIHLCWENYHSLLKTCFGIIINCVRWVVPKSYLHREIIQCLSHLPYSTIQTEHSTMPDFIPSVVAEAKEKLWTRGLFVSIRDLLALYDSDLGNALVANDHMEFKKPFITSCHVISSFSLVVVASVCFQYVEAQNDVSQGTLDLMNYVVKNLGWHDQQWFFAGLDLSTKYTYQITSLVILGEWAAQNPPNEALLKERVAPKKIAESILWAFSWSRAEPINSGILSVNLTGSELINPEPLTKVRQRLAAPDPESKKKPVQSPVGRLRSSTGISSPSRDAPRSRALTVAFSKLSQSGSKSTKDIFPLKVVNPHLKKYFYILLDWIEHKLLSDVTINAFVRLFDDIETISLSHSDQTKSLGVDVPTCVKHAPEIQLLIISILYRSFLVVPSYLKYKIYNIMLNPHFLYSLFDDFSRELRHSEISEESLVVYQQTLRLSLSKNIFKCLTHICVNCPEPLTEIDFLLSQLEVGLLSALNKSASSLSLDSLCLCFHLSKVLCSVIASNTMKVSEVIMTVSGLERLSMIISNLQSLFLSQAQRGDLLSPSSDFTQVEGSLLNDIRRLVFTTLELYFAQRLNTGFDGYYDALLNSTLVQTLFDLLLSPDTMPFALLHLTRIMKLDPIQFEQKAQPTSLKTSNAAEGQSFESRQLAIYQQFLEFLVTLNQQKLNKPLLLLLIDDGILKIATGKHDATREQSMFRKAGFFTRLLDFLNTTPEQQELGELCLVVLKGIMHIMANSEKNKLFFKNQVGYPQLAKLIVNSFDHSLTNNLVDVLFDMLFDGKFQTNSRMIIQNHEIVVLIFNLFQYFGSTEQIKIFNFLIDLLSQHPINRSICCSAGLNLNLISMIPVVANLIWEKNSGTDCILLERLMSTIEILAKNSITVPELRLLLNLAAPRKTSLFIGNAIQIKELIGGSQSDGVLDGPTQLVTWFTLRTIHVIISRQGPRKVEGRIQIKWPRVMFDFDGKSSRLTLPPIQCFPPPSCNSFSFSTWIRVESYASPARVRFYEPRLWSMLTADGDGFELILREGALYFQSRSGDPKQRLKQRFKFDFSFFEHQWYNLVLTVVNSSMPWGKSADITLYVNGECLPKCAFKGLLQFNNLMLNCIGCGSQASLGLDERADDHEVDVDPNLKYCFFGSMAAVYLFRTEITNTQAKEMFELGPDYDGDFSLQSVNLEAALGADLVAGMNIFDGDLKSSVFAFYNCKGLHGNICYDNALEKSLDHVLDAAASNVISNVRCHARHIISCIGGVSMIIPLFLHLNLPPSEIPGQNPSMLALSLFDTLNCILQHSIKSRSEMEKCHGFSVISYLLLHVSPGCLSVSLLNKVQEFFQGNLSLPVIDEALFYFFLDFELWVFAEYAVQIHLLTRLLPALVVRFQRIRFKLFGVQGFLDMIRLFYWDLPQPRISKAQESWLHGPDLDQLPKEKSNSAMRSQLRIAFYDLIWLMVASSITRSECRFLLEFLEATSAADPQPCLELLKTFERKLLLDDLRQDAQTETGQEEQMTSEKSKWCFFEVLALEGGLNALSKLLSSKYDTVQVQVLRIMIRFVRVSERFETKEQTFPSWGSTKKPLSHHLEDFRAIEKILFSTAFTPLIFHAISHLIRDELFFLESLSTAAYPQEFPNPITKHLVISNPGLLPVFCRLAVGSRLQLSVLQELTTITATDQNIRIFLEMPFWETWVLALNGYDWLESKKVYVARNSTEEYPLTDDEMIDSLNKELVKIFSQVLTFALCTLKNGNDVLLTMFSHIRNRLDSSTTKDSSYVKVITKSEELICCILEAVIPNLLKRVCPPILGVSETLKNALNFQKSSFESMNILFALRAIEDLVLFTAGKLESQNPAPWRYQTLVELALEIFESTGMLEPGNQFLAKNSNPVLGTWESFRQLAISFASIWFFHFGEQSLVERHVEKLRAWLQKPGTPQLEKESSMFVLVHLVNAINLKMIKYSGRLPSICDGIIPFMRDLLAYFAPDAIHMVGANSLQAVSLFFSELTNEERSNRHFFATVCDSSMLDLIRPGLLLTVQPKLTRDDTITNNAEKERKRTMTTLARMAWQDSLVEEELSKKHLSLIKMIDFKLPLKREKSPFDFQFERMILRKNRNDIRAKQAQSWRRIVRLHLLVCGHIAQTQQKVHWRMNFEENSCRMHLKMKQNHIFNDHKDALVVHKGRPRKEPEVTVEDQEEQIANEMILARLAELEIVNVRSKTQPASQSDGDPEPTEPIGDESEPVVGSEQPLEQEPVHFRVPCKLVTLKSIINGILKVCTTTVMFTEVREEDTPTEQAKPQNNKPEFPHVTPPKRSEPNKPLKHESWSLAQFSEIHHRRFLLCPNAIEIFMHNKKRVFFVFKKNLRGSILRKLKNLNPNILIESEDPREILEKSGFTQAWQNGEISNFEYLMHLNTIAGRSHNDLTQYPVFPWILTDYKSPTINLADPAVYRDLSLPVGALNPKRLKMFLERYNNWCDTTLPAFLYGSHYSSPHTVCHYMIRVEPFTSLAIEQQDGKFDHADRLFHSLDSTWTNVLNGSADVKELIPEFFYLPEFLRNENRFDFGEKQSGIPVGDVILPPWASSPEEFIRIQRQALESDLVSNTLHLWVDLIFGYKQTGEEAVAANNVFHYLTYESSVDIEKISDPRQREAMEATIANFGQTPCQLLFRPHPPRNAGNPAPLWKRLPLFALPLQFTIDRIPNVGNGQIHCLLVAREGATISQESKQHLSVNESGDSGLRVHRLITIDSTRQFLTQRLMDTNNLMVVRDTNARSGRLLLPKRPQPNNFAISRDGKIIFSGGHWDNAIYATNILAPGLFQCLHGHTGRVTCLNRSEDGKYLVSGSVDTTALVWLVFSPKSLKSFLHLPQSPLLKKMVSKMPIYVSPQPLCVLYGHQTPITAIAISSDLNICISCSEGAVIIHNLTGDFIRHIPLLYENSICSAHLIVVDPVMGSFVVYSKQHNILFQFSVNGALLRTRSTNETVADMCLTSNAKYLVHAGPKGQIVARDFSTLESVYKYQAQTPITSLATVGESLVVGGTGELWILRQKNGTQQQ